MTDAELVRRFAAIVAEIARETPNFERQTRCRYLLAAMDHLCPILQRLNVARLQT